LADHFLSLAGQEEATKDAKLRNIQILRQNGRPAEADELQRSMDGAAKRIKEYNEKAVKLIKRSLEVMPPKLVIDYGEPSPSREKYQATGVEMTTYQDGILHDYVAILYRAGDKKGAEELGKEVARQLETILNYFAKSKANFAGSLDNSEDLYSALDSYFKLHVSALDPDNGDPKGELAKRTRNKLDELYKVSFPELFRQLEEKAASNGESIRRGSKSGKYARMLFDLQDYIQAIGTHYGYLEGPGGRALPSPEDAAGMDMEELMMQMQMQDSTQQ
jgi:hypothetical protein